MHFINFIVAICLPYITLFSRLAPPSTIPVYFYSDEGAFVAGEFGAIIFYWAGLLRNFVERGVMSDRQYFTIATLVLIFICGSKIIFTMPYSWITNIFAFGLGVLSLTRGQTLGKKTLVIIVVMSIIILAFSTFILLGMAWFGFQPISYYHYRDLIHTYIFDSVASARYWLKSLTS